MLLAMLLGVPVLGTLLAASLALRLCWGPIELGWLAHRLAPRDVAGETLGFDRFRLGWGEPGRSGAGGPVILEATGLSLRRPDGQTDLRAAHAAVSLDLAALLAGTMSVRRVTVADAALRLRRAPDGTVSLAGAPAAPPGRKTAGGHGLDRLRAADLRQVSVSLFDERSRRTLAVAIDDARLWPWGSLAGGRLRAVLSVDGRSIQVAGDGTADATGLRWRLDGGAVVPAAFAALLPGLAGIDLPVTPAVTLRFGPGSGWPDSASLVLALGGGTLALGEGTLPVAEGRIAIEARRDGTGGLRATLDGLRLALAAPAGTGAGLAVGGTTPAGKGVAVAGGAGPAGSGAATAGQKADLAGRDAAPAGKKVVPAGGTGPAGRGVGPAGDAAAAVEHAAVPAARDAAPAGNAVATAGEAGPAGSGAAAGPVFTAQGTLSLDRLTEARRIRASLVVDSARIGFDGLSRYWPAGIAVGARRWITANLVEGVATGLHVETALAGDSGWGSVREVRRAGGFDARDLVMWWLRPMPPLRGMRARVSFDGTDALLVESPDATLPVEVVGPEARRLCPGAAPAPIAVSDASMRITGLDAEAQIGAIRLVLTGGLDGLMCELANPRLSLLSRHPVSFTAPSGRTRTEVAVRLPLDDAVAIEDLTVSARSAMRGAHLGDVAAGMALDDANLAVSADTGGLVLQGEGAGGAIRSRLRYEMDFRAGPPDQAVERAAVHGAVGAPALAALGLDPGDALSGEGGLAVSYLAHRDGRSTVDLALDMTGLAIALPVWNKPAGRPGHAEARIVLEHGHLQSVGPIRAEGPALFIEGGVTMPPGGPHRLDVSRFRVGRTSGAGAVLFPRGGTRGTAVAAGSGGGADPIRVSAHGPALDLAAIIDAAPARTPPRPGAAAAAKAGPSAPGPAWTADLRFGRVFVGRGATLGDVSAHLENDGRALVGARVDALAPTRIVVRLDTRDGARLVDGSAEDTGTLLGALGVTDRIAGGRLRVTARLPPPQAGSGIGAAPITGTVQIDRFVLPDAPFAARLLRDLSIYGWLLAPNAPDLTVDRLVAPFSLSDEVLTLRDARAHAAALGVTMRGAVDLRRQMLDLQGTVVPAWALNQLPGRLPLVGRLLAPEKGGGVVAVTLGIKGPFAGPRVSVNALSALAPGFLRKLFFE